MSLYSEIAHQEGKESEEQPFISLSLPALDSKSTPLTPASEGKQEAPALTRLPYRDGTAAD
jgi:hypothetical protein